MAGSRDDKPLASILVELDGGLVHVDTQNLFTCWHLRMQAVAPLPRGRNLLFVAPRNGQASVVGEENGSVFGTLLTYEILLAGPKWGPQCGPFVGCCHEQELVFSQPPRWAFLGAT